MASLGPFIDTLVICTMTGLVILLSGAWRDKVETVLGLDQVTAVIAPREVAAADQDLQDLIARRQAGGGTKEPERRAGEIDGWGDTSSTS